MSDEKKILFQSKGFPEFRFLSNFHKCTIMGRGFQGEVLAFDSVEHMYQCQKATTKDEFDFIYASSTPNEARKRGQQVKLGPAWDACKDAIMELCVRAKFLNHPELKDLLLATDDFELVEHAPWDTQGSYWGVNKEGKGKNMLGKILMKVREELREKE